MARKRNKKVTLSIDSSTYDSFRSYCEDNAIMLSKKVEIWMKNRQEHPDQRRYAKAKKQKNSNKKVTLSIDSSTYDDFKSFCEENAIMLSKKVEIWMSQELRQSTGKGGDSK